MTTEMMHIFVVIHIAYLKNSNRWPNLYKYMKYKKILIGEEIGN